MKTPIPTPPARPSGWQRKLRYLLSHHGCLKAVATAAGLRPAAVERLAAGTSTPAAASLEAQALRRIERELDLAEGWFDASVFLPSRL